MARVFFMLKTNDLKKVSMEYRKKKITPFLTQWLHLFKALAKIPMITHDQRCILISKYTFLPTQPPELVNSIFSSMAKHLYGKNQ